MDSYIYLSVITNLSVGFFSIATALVVLFYRKNFSFYKGIIILLLLEGILVCSIGLMNFSNASLLFTLYFIARALIPGFLLLFSEYVLRINYHIGIKLFLLISTTIIFIASFFQKDFNSVHYSAISDYFLLIIVAIVLIHTGIYLIRQKDLLMRRYLLLSLLASSVITINEVLKQLNLFYYNFFLDGLVAFILTHVIIIIITSGGFTRMDQKIPKLLFIICISITLPALMKLLFPSFSSGYLFALFILTATALSLFYMFSEASKNSTELRSSILISRLLKMPFHNHEDFFKSLKNWREVKDVHYIKHTEVEGKNLSLLFQKAGRVVHKYQLPELKRALDYNPGFISGIEMAQYFFKKLNCDSFFQLTEKGDFIAIEYIDGLNPALYTNELAIMGKIIFSVSASKINS